MPDVLYGETTRSAPARRSLLSDSSWLARATTAMSGRSSRAVSAMKMFSASESTQATTARARSMPASRSAVSSDGLARMKRTPGPTTCSWLAGSWSTIT